MKNPFSSLSNLDIRSSLLGVIKRFPLPTLLVFVTTIFCLYQLNSVQASEWIYRMIVTLITTFFLASGSSLFSENKSPKKYIPIITTGIPIVFGLIFYYGLLGMYDVNSKSATYVLMTLFGFIAFIFTAPFLRFYRGQKSENSIHFYNYFTNISWVFLMSYIVGVSLLLLGFIAIASVTTLFDLSQIWDEDKLFGNWAILALSLIAPLYMLVHLPQPTDYEQSGYRENRFFSFIVQYIMTPFISVYFIILYAYSIKVLANFGEWPNGKISWMVIGFTTFGYLVYIFSQAYESRSRMIVLFRKYFAFAVLPQIAMLFYAIYLRIAQYDLTMNRYFVLAFGLWLTIISLYYVISKSKQLSIIPVSLLCIILVISIGPWSVYQVPLVRQYDRLIDNLEKAHILKDGKITPLGNPMDISKQLSNDIYSGISYVCEFDNCHLIKQLFEKEIREITEKNKADWEKRNTINTIYSGVPRWIIVSELSEMIQVQANHSYTIDDGTAPMYIQYNIRSSNDGPYPINTTGYTKLVKVYGQRSIGDSDNSIMDYPYIKINPDTDEVVYHQDTPSKKIPLKLHTPRDLKNNTIPSELDEQNLTFTAVGDGIEAKLILNNYAVKNPQYTGTLIDDSIYYSIDGIALIKEIR